MNVQVLEAAFDWIPLLSDAATQSERTPWIALVENALHVTLGMLPESSDSDDEINGTPYKYDYWVLKRAAVCIAQMTKGEDPARLWRPILDLGGRAHCWISAFIDNWFVFGVRAASTPQQFAERWGGND